MELDLVELRNGKQEMGTETSGVCPGLDWMGGFLLQ
jgi:hypothetical protein